VILIAPDAEQQAAAADKRRADGKALGPLDGVPILIKDNIDATGMPTTAGSFLLEHNVPAKDSEVARRLRAAGAVILGKTNLSQWAGWRDVASFNGSTVGRGPHNPYDLARTPAGSSSGSGIATATSFAAATIGTETSGSITGPSTMNGIVGMKPTIALVSRRGVVPIGHTQDSAGPMARTVMDAAILLNAVAGTDSEGGDPDSKDADAHKTDYTAALKPDALKGVRLGVVRGLRGYDEKTEPVYNAALEVLKAQGAELVEIGDPHWEDLSNEQRVVLSYDFKQDLNAYLAGTSPEKVKARTLTEAIAFNTTDEREKGHGNDVWTASDATAGFDADEYKTVLAEIRRKTREEGIDKLLKDNNVEALVNLTGGPAAVIQEDGTKTLGAGSVHEKGAVPPSATLYAAVAQYPHLTVPMGQVEGLPVGLSFIGTAWTEPKLLAYGYAYEQASKKRVPPTAYKTAATAAAKQ
jgi:amidase